MDKQVKQRIEQLNNGETPDGYKKTDFGVFPRDWVTDKTLGDLFDFYGGLSKSRDELGEEGYAYLHYGDLHRGSFNTVPIDQYEQLPKCDVSLTGKEKCLMKDGDVAFLDASEDLEGTSRAVLIDNPDNKPFIAGLHIIYGKAKNNNLEKWFKQYITSSESVKKQFQRLAVGFKVYGVNRDTIPRIRIAYPSSSQEQSRIAEILMKWDEAIDLYDKQIEALTQYKKICLRKMFPKKGQNVPEWRFQGFSGDWKRRKVSEITLFHKQGFYTTESYDDAKKYYLLRGTDLADNRLILKDTPKINATEKDYQAFKTQVGDFLIVRSGNAGTYGVVYEEIPAIFGSYLIDFRFDKSQVTNEFFGYFYQSDLFKSQLQQIIQHSANTNINAENIKSTSIKLPSIIEQKRIGLFFTKIDNLITLHQCKKEAITNQRKTLQQYLLNGIIRV